VSYSSERHIRGWVDDKGGWWWQPFVQHGLVFMVGLELHASDKCLEEEIELVPLNAWHHSHWIVQKVLQGVLDSKRGGAGEQDMWRAD
jgi:hypothetical protein